MPDTFCDRHQDNVIDVGAVFGTSPTAIGSLVAGKQYPGIPLTIDADAPFHLKALAVRMNWDADTGQNGLANLWYRLKRGNGDYMSQDWVPFVLAVRLFGQGGNPAPVWPWEAYPPGGVIEIDLWNRGNTALPGVQVVCRGVRRYPPLPSLYPKKIREIRNYTRSLKQTGVGLTPVTGGDVRNIQILPQMTNNLMMSSDFVLRHLTGGSVFNDKFPSSFVPARNVWCVLKDHQERPFSNLPVDINILFQQPLTNTDISGCVGQFGPWHPALIYPEVYIPQGQGLYLDIYRDDTGQAGGAAVRLDFAFGGVRVYPSLDPVTQAEQAAKMSGQTPGQGPQDTSTGSAGGPGLGPYDPLQYGGAGQPSSKGLYDVAPPKGTSPGMGRIPRRRK